MTASNPLFIRHVHVSEGNGFELRQFVGVPDKQ